MTYLTVEHKVKDYKTWKEVFDNFESTRKSGGEKSYRIMRPQDEPNNLHLTFEWDTPEKAQTFFESTELKDAMEKGGVVDKPRVNFMELLDQGKF